MEGKIILQRIVFNFELLESMLSSIICHLLNIEEIHHFSAVFTVQYLYKEVYIERESC